MNRAAVSPIRSHLLGAFRGEMLPDLVDIMVLYCVSENVPLIQIDLSLGAYVDVRDPDKYALCESAISGSWAYARILGQSSSISRPGNYPSYLQNVENLHKPHDPPLDEALGPKEIVRWIYVQFIGWSSSKWIPITDRPFSVQPPGWITDAKCITETAPRGPSFCAGEDVLVWNRDTRCWSPGRVEHPSSASNGQWWCPGAQWSVNRQTYYGAEIQHNTHSAILKPLDPTLGADGHLAGSPEWQQRVEMHETNPNANRESKVGK